MLTVQLPQDLETRLATLAQATGRTLEECITAALVEYLDDLEDLYLAEQRWLNFPHGKDQVIDGEEFWRNVAD